MSKKIKEKLFEYICSLSAGKTSREHFDDYRKFLDACGPAEVNSAIDSYMETEPDFDQIEKTVARFIRACGRGLESAPPFETDIPFISILLEENSRLRKYRTRITIAYKKAAAELKAGETLVPASLAGLKEGVELFYQYRSHYLKLQNALFPAFEQYADNMNCLKLMWHIQDEIVGALKILIKIIDTEPFDFMEFNRIYGEMFLKMGNLIYREEKILFPLAVSILPEEEFPGLLSDVEVLGTAFNVYLPDFTGGRNMSENLNNNRKRKDELNRIISALNESEDHASVQKQIKKDFKRLLDTLSPEEVAEAEQALIAEGVPVEEVQKLCELHVDTFHDALKGASKRAGSGNEKISGHPVANYKAENKALKSQIANFRKAVKKLKKTSDFEVFDEALNSISMIEVHFTRKENQLFPFLENVGFTGPSKVMWGKHDEIRDALKKLKIAVKQKNLQACISSAKLIIPQLKRMIFMEERILFPTALRKLPESAWAEIRKGESEIGYAWIKPGNLWAPEITSQNISVKSSSIDTEDDLIDLSVGKLSPSQINLMLTNLPVDITFVDEYDNVRYFSQGKERIFPRSPGIIGRSVQNCHPPKSVHIVQKIVDDFKAGKRDVAEFWIQMNGAFIHIRYFPLFEGKQYKGVIEVSQEISGIRALEGEKRLLDEE